MAEATVQQEQLLRDRALRLQAVAAPREPVLGVAVRRRFQTPPDLLHFANRLEIYIYRDIEAPAARLKHRRHQI